MIWRVSTTTEDVLIDSVSRSGARIMAAQLGYTPTGAKPAEANYEGKVHVARFNTNPSDPKILDLRSEA